MFAVRKDIKRSSNLLLVCLEMMFFRLKSVEMFSFFLKINFQDKHLFNTRNVK